MSHEASVPRVHGLLLAAGSGSRMGGPKALVTGPDGESWLRRSIAVLRDGGCEGVTVVLGARADVARDLVPDGVGVVVAADWADGMAASLRAGLGSLSSGGTVAGVDAALVHLVDLPDVGAEVVRRVLEACAGPHALARATYAGRPGHPVLIGRQHWSAVVRHVSGDAGARTYLHREGAVGVECGDLASGEDVDRRPT